MNSSRNLIQREWIFGTKDEVQQIYRWIHANRPRMADMEQAIKGPTWNQSEKTNTEGQDHSRLTTETVYGRGATVLIETFYLPKPPGSPPTPSTDMPLFAGGQGSQRDHLRRGGDYFGSDYYCSDFYCSDDYCRD